MNVFKKLCMPFAPAKSGRVYDWAYRHDLIIGSGVNVVGTRKG